MNFNPKIIILLLFFIIFLKPSIFADDIALKEYWAEVFLYNQKVGNYHYKLNIDNSTTGEENYKIIFEYTSIPQEGEGVAKNNLELITDKDFKIKAFQRTIINKDEKISIHATNENGALNLNIDRNNYTVKKIISIGNDVFSAAALQEKIARDAPEKGEYSYKVFDEDSLTIREEKINVLEKKEELVDGKPINLYKIERKNDLFKDVVIKMLIAEDGTLLTLQSDELNYLVLKTSKDEAKGSGKSFPPAIPRFLSLDTFFLKPENLEYLKIKIKLERPYALDGISQDSKQVIEKADDELFLLIKSKANDISSIPKETVDEKNISQYLPDSVYLTLNDSEVKELLKQIIGNNKDPLTKVRNISTWIFKNIKQEYNGKSLSAAEVIREKKGDCTEYAVLFCSLARSADIPAKMVVGVSYAFGNLVGHMWNEVWIDGRWIPVDSTLNQVGIDAAHIKFIDTDFDFTSLTLYDIQQIKSYYIKDFITYEFNGTIALKKDEILNIPTPAQADFSEQILPVISPKDIIIERPFRIAVAKFTNTIEDEKFKEVENGLWALIRRDLMCVKKFSVLSSFMNPKERDFSLKSKEELEDISRKLGVEYIIFGEINKKDSQITLIPKIYDSQKKEVVGFPQFACEREEDILKQEKEIVMKMPAYFKISLSKEEVNRISSGYLPSFDALWAYSAGVKFKEISEENPIFQLNSLIYFQFALKIDPNFALPYAELGRFFESPLTINQSYEAFNKAILLDPYFAEAYWSYNIAMIYTQERSQVVDDAIILLKKSLSVSPYFGKSHLSLASRYKEKKLIDEALEELKKAEILTPADPYLYDTYGLIYLYDRNDPDAAIVYFQKTLEVDPSLTKTSRNLAECYLRKKQYDQATDIVMKAIEVDPKDKDNYEKLGDVYCERKWWAQARKAYLEAMEIDSKDARIQYLIGYTYSMEKNYRDAISRYKKALELNPTLYNVHNNLGYAYFDGVRNFEEAIKEFQLEIKFHPENSLPYTNLADLYRIQGKIEDAFETYKKAVEVAPTELDPYIFLVRLCGEYNVHTEEGIVFGEKAVEIDSGSFEVWETLGLVYYNSGRYKEAADAYENSLKLCVQPEVLYKLSMACSKIGDRKRAKEVLNKAKEIKSEDDNSYRTKAEEMLGQEKSN